MKRILTVAAVLMAVINANAQIKTKPTAVKTATPPKATKKVFLEENIGSHYGRLSQDDRMAYESEIFKQFEQDYKTHLGLDFKSKHKMQLAAISYDGFDRGYMFQTTKYDASGNKIIEADYLVSAKSGSPDMLIKVSIPAEGKLQLVATNLKTGEKLDNTQDGAEYSIKPVVIELLNKLGVKKWFAESSEAPKNVRFRTVTPDEDVSDKLVKKTAALFLYSGYEYETPGKVHGYAFSKAIPESKYTREKYYVTDQKMNDVIVAVESAKPGFSGAPISLDFTTVQDNKVHTIAVKYGMEPIGVIMDTLLKEGYLK